ncbi:bifunctional 4-hydroxy-2-oxoglutarate aldolase/2-dehydro-3-deoxy-phosphogluconate aldolase [Azospirillum sp. TSO22-1]|uniref:bifunctional 4-hydroxy-2-oxoglutarate aldolase/2-dehydro-3-deoxy-phosphogluconate aldolase n=1 Tax=Azospirillum sp. TSO22-1 TaxID=716789 RepID=UPI000D60D62A|nr:bifunctional 4-hydroxy-2-oxoglutarate aldolase/2-dehydro-3-deoxy-phosphogluconate aldolase [Azospirillum sp. TSO22-1]PWC52460.1 keto-deoxy-phosphogluconate aldolase [Azospirillum sp. TSO22-1]
MRSERASLAAVLGRAPVIPVLVVDDAAVAVPLARALVAGGLPVLEVTLRTPAAREAVRRIRAEVPEAVVGVGTVLTPEQLREAEADGAAFAVSPGATPRLLDAAVDTAVPLLPGVATVGEAMAAAERGYAFLKFFPAEAAGGVAALRAMASPLPHLRFCPTGGIGPDKAAEYLRLPNVVCVGGSWLTPPAALKAGDWEAIRVAAGRAAALRYGPNA